jgi:SAM-dependent methyltransferase
MACRPEGVKRPKDLHVQSKYRSFAPLTLTVSADLPRGRLARPAHMPLRAIDVQHPRPSAPASGGLLSRPSWLPEADALRNFYGETSAYPYYRLQVTDYISRLLPAGSLKIIDVGSGDGYLGAVLQTFRPNTTVVGVETHRRELTRPGFEPVLYDGRSIPFGDRAFDVAIVTNVLHHADDQLAVLAETCRVTRSRVIVKDHLARHFLDRWKIALLDIAGNRRFGADTHGDYLDRAQWGQMFAQLPNVKVTWYMGLSFRTGLFELAFPDELEVMFALDLA